MELQTYQGGATSGDGCQQRRAHGILVIQVPRAPQIDQQVDPRARRLSTLSLQSN